MTISRKLLITKLNSLEAGFILEEAQELADKMLPHIPFSLSDTDRFFNIRASLEEIMKDRDRDGGPTDMRALRNELGRNPAPYFHINGLPFKGVAASYSRQAERTAHERQEAALKEDPQRLFEDAASGMTTTPVPDRQIEQAVESVAVEAEAVPVVESPALKPVKSPAPQTPDMRRLAAHFARMQQARQTFEITTPFQNYAASLAPALKGPK